MKNNQQKRILIIEGNKALNDTLVNKLKREDFNVEESSNGKEGLELCYNSHPDLILLDMEAPIINGHEFMEHLREDTWGKNAKVIILSNISMKHGEIAKTVIQKDPIAFLVKSSTKLRDLIEYVHYAFKD
ncbi:MAG: CheY-like chemotaxis protein [Candidatus Paceibacteria bacterium]|jgi:CheY-like chemotaxis protein